MKKPMIIDTLLPQCARCARYNEEETRILLSCEAFPDGIPDDIFFNTLDHTKPINGDHGLQFVEKAVG